MKGPPHTHMHSNDNEQFCYFLGHVSPSDCPGQYLNYIKQCFDDYQKHQLINKSVKIPLIVNTMGWNQGLGLCLLKEIFVLINPTHVIQINHPVETNKNMPILDNKWLQNSDGWPPSFKSSNQSDTSLNDSTNNNEHYKLIVIKSKAPVKTVEYQSLAPSKKFSPKDQRNLATISYFGRLQTAHKSMFKPINSLIPYKVSWSTFALHVSHVDVVYDNLLYAFNASLVALCQIDKKFVI
jgi:polynucleotide 5'-hydroxyl-kinase GRC3/NOL9